MCTDFPPLPGGGREEANLDTTHAYHNRVQLQRTASVRRNGTFQALRSALCTRAGGTGPADPANAGPIFPAYHINFHFY